jgi:hypothetical protein
MTTITAVADNNICTLVDLMKRIYICRHFSRRPDFGVNWRMREISNERKMAAGSSRQLRCAGVVLHAIAGIPE